MLNVFENKEYIKNGEKEYQIIQKEKKKRGKEQGENEENIY